MDSIKLNELYPSLKGGFLTPLVSPYPFDDPNISWKRPALIVVPGGAYLMTSKREGFPIAFRFAARGFQTFVLEYACSPEAVYPEQLKELSCAVDYVKKNSEEFGVNPDEVFCIGFSAGGHLVGDLAMEENEMQKHGLDVDCSVKAVGLIYPVISNALGHVESYKALLHGLENQSELLDRLSLDKHVHAGHPPVFIASSFMDDCVPVLNSLEYAKALNACKIPFELHIFPTGWHGFSNGSDEVNPNMNHSLLSKSLKEWPDMCADFFASYCVEDLK